MLMGIVRISVIGAGTNAKASAFMYSEVVAATASLRHNGVLQTPPASSVGMRSASCVVLAMSHGQVSSTVKKCSFTSSLSGHRSGDLIMCLQKAETSSKVSLEQSLSGPN